MQKSLKVIISGGGTGGHIFPAISIANALKLIDPAIEILFVGAKGRMEMEKIPQAGYKIQGLSISGLQRRLTYKNFILPFKITNSLRQAAGILKSFKPDAAVGVGGYASGALLYMASRRKIPYLIQEQNSYPGITNRILAKKARKICVAYDGMDKYFPAEKIIMTGNPVRQDLENIHDKKEEAIHFFGLDIAKKTLLVIGGSLGARTINQSLLQNIGILKNAGIQVIWQTGKGYYRQAKSQADHHGLDNLHVHDFINRMDLAYSVANVVISRAGAGTISELCLVGKACILVPSPNVAEDHQTKNAMALVNEHAAMMVPDVEAPARLIQAALTLMADRELTETLSANIRKLAIRDSARKIAEEVLQIIQ
ncbi:MAG: undecaprenyldiphospho-muramoylpentapeptide beta-N-acetylglucosaminyltransferase [Bacteroidia bacterium]|nr:undecaprenyldiphospho-muramoylpentapeptide beta-N-acetylglucosaminyltransferase [Bacteroidia bacterium]